jgi:hypothetical protein
MTGFRTRLSAVCSCLALAASTASGGVDSFTITDGAVDFTLNNLTGLPTGSSGGTGNLRTGVDGTATDHLFQNWFWFRNTDDTRERALSNQTLTSASGNRARLTYVEPSDNGVNPNALLVELEYTIHDLSNGGPPHALLVIAFKIQNLTDSDLNVQFFNYNDFDLNGTNLSDSAVVTGADDQTQLVGDGNAEAAYSSSATNHTHFQMGVFPSIRNALTDAGVDDLNDSASSFGPGDYTGANQWSVQLSAAPSVQSTLVGSVAIVLTRNTCPGDTNGDGAVDVDDLVEVILGWGMCP